MINPKIILFKRFTDVKGVDEVLNEFEQVVDILKNPEKFRKMGAKTPRGILLNGPPGTGKTLIAKAIAGEGEGRFFFNFSQFD